MCEDCVHKNIPGGCPIAKMFLAGQPGEFRSSGPGVQCVMFHEFDGYVDTRPHTHFVEISMLEAWKSGTPVRG